MVLQMYADLIAQCVYSTVIFAYPNSWVSFDEDFKSELCLYISLWQVGTKPAPNTWIKWELRLLEPIDLPKCKASKGEEVGVKSAGSFDFDSLLKDARQKEAFAKYQQKLKSQSSYEKRLSLLEVKTALSYSKRQSADLKKRQRSTEMRTPSPDEGRVGVAMEQLNTLEQNSTCGVHLLMVPSRVLSPSSSPTQSPRSLQSSPTGHDAGTESPASNKRQVSLSAPSREMGTPRRASSPEPSIAPQRASAPQQSLPKPSVESRRVSSPQKKRENLPKPSMESRRTPSVEPIKAGIEPRKVSSPMPSAKPKRGSSSKPSVEPIKVRSCSKPGVEPRKVSSPKPSVEERKRSSSKPRRKSSPKPSIDPKRPSSSKQSAETTTRCAREAGKLNLEGRDKGSPRLIKDSPWPRRRRIGSPSSGASQSVAAKSAKETSRNAPEVSACCGRRSVQSSSRTSATPKRIVTASTDPQPTSSAVGAPLVPISHGEKYDGKLKRMALSFKKQEASATLRGPEFEHVVFNLYGHSPLVKHYMERMNLSHVNEKEIVVGRTEITEEPPPDAVCYRDILVESKVVTESNREQFLRYAGESGRPETCAWWSPLGPVP